MIEARSLRNKKFLHILESGQKCCKIEGREVRTMKFKMIHENYNVSDLQASLDFYEKALGLTEKRRKTAQDGSFIIVYVGNDNADFELELTWLKEHPQKYDIGEEEFHLAFRTDDYDAAHQLHEEIQSQKGFLTFSFL